MNDSEEHNGISRRGAAYERDTVGISRVIIPPEIDREKYIQHCYQCCTVSIVSRVNLDVVHDVPVDISTLQNIEFPEDKGSLGSTVVWVNLPIYNSPVIVAVLTNSDEMTTQVEEGEFTFTRISEDGQVSVSGKSRGGQIDVVAQSNSNKGGALRVNVSNRSGTAQLDIIVNGDFTMSANSSEIKMRDSFYLGVNDGKKNTKDTFISFTRDEVESRTNESTSGFKFSDGSFEVGDASRKAVLAEDLEKFLHSFIDVVASSTVATSMGPQPLINAASILQLKSQTTPWISKYLKIQ